MSEPFPKPKNRGWMWYFLILALLTVTASTTMIVFNLRQQLKPEQLEAARALWVKKNVRDYDMEIQITRGDNAPEEYAVRVRNGEVIQATLNGIPLYEEPARACSMTSLFGFVDGFLKQDAEPNKPKTFCVASFDPEDGHLMRYVRRVMGSRERVQIIVKKFTRVDEK